MLGELIYEGSGKRNVRRVVSIDPVQLEVTFEGSGKMHGLDVMEIGTYHTMIRSDGTLYGEGQGVIMSADGDLVTWKGTGTGSVKAGTVSYRGSISYHTASPKLARLNTVAGVFEFESGQDGSTQAKVWEWK